MLGGTILQGLAAKDSAYFAQVYVGDWKTKSEGDKDFFFDVHFDDSGRVLGSSSNFVAKGRDDAMTAPQKLVSGLTIKGLVRKFARLPGAFAGFAPI